MGHTKILVSIALLSIFGILGASLLSVLNQPTSPQNNTTTKPSAVLGASTNSVRLASNNTLVLPDGKRFIVEGVNIEFFRDYANGCGYVTDNGYTARVAMVNAMKNLGINAVRVNYSKQFINSSSLSKMLEVMKLFADNKIFVMPSDHTFTGQSLGNRSSVYSTFKSIIDGARAQGFEQWLIMNPYNEPGPSNDWGTWVSANNDTLSNLRNSMGFKGLVVLDTRSWAADFDVNSMQQVKNYDAQLLGGAANVAFSNHWYPNIPYSSISNSINSSGSVPVLIGEIGRINPGSSGIDENYVRTAMNDLVNGGLNKGHNGVFAWIWNWCDENTMTTAWDNYTDLNSYGKIFDDLFYKKVVGNTMGGGTASKVCGDGTIQTPNDSGVNEVCDDGNTTNNDQCSSDCRNKCTAPQTWNGSTCVNPPKVCGDGIIQIPNDSGVSEVCDDGNTSNNDQCSSDCRNKCTTPQVWNGTTCIAATNQGLVIDTALTLDKSSIAASGGTITGIVKYRNTNSSPLTIDEIVIAGRPPGGTNQNGPYYDFTPGATNVTLQAGAVYTLTASRVITSSDPTGQWYAFSTYRDTSGWHDAPATLNKTFTVGVTTTKPEGCNADYNNNGTLDIADFQTFGQNYKVSSIQCSLDVVGNNCYLDIADFQAFGQIYKVSNACI